MTNSLDTLLRLRQRSVDDARRDVAETIAAEAHATQAVAAAEAELDAEMRAAVQLEGGDGAVESFARWLPVGRQTIARCRDAERDAAARVDRARAVLSLARAALRAVEIMIEKRNAERELAEGRKAQAELDEVARRRPR